MGALVEICSSHYEHQPLEKFSDKHYYYTADGYVVCDECIKALNDALIDTTVKFVSSVKSTVEKALEDGQYLFGGNINRDESIVFKSSLSLPIWCNFGGEDDGLIQFTVDPVNDVLDDLDEDGNNKIRTALGTVCINTIYKTQYLLEIYVDDSEEDIRNRISEFLDTVWEIYSKVIPDETVQQLMDDKSSSKFSSGKSNKGCCCY